jgi:predicted DNA-binding transcriptional regulator AlpA
VNGKGEGDMQEDLMTVPEVLAELRDVSRRTFYRWRELGIAPVCLRLPNGSLRIRRGDFRAWLDERSEEAA